MPPHRPPAAEAADLLAGQLADLARYRQVIEAQRAVLRMEDAGLIEIFASEAAGIVADISAREVRLLAIRATAATMGQPEPESSRPLAELRAKVAREQAEAGAAALDLARTTERDSTRIAAQIRVASQQLGVLMRGYGNGPGAAPPSVIDRRG
ncbi:MAG TPA: hypothetical protein VHW65_13375 [Gemmatimonadales bacterium]|jgi:hypothetical protein|nr:hypothetical protein [Gemmatimonadales bacterium]